MKVDISGRHLLVTQAMKDYAREKTERLSRYYDRVQRIQVVMDVQGERKQVEVVVSLSRGSTVVAHANDSSMYAALDLAVDKCERQLTKLKEKLRDHKGRMSMAGNTGFEVEPASPSDSEIDFVPERDEPVQEKPPLLPPLSEKRKPSARRAAGDRASSPRRKGKKAR